jgi:hypothetical protein
MMEMIHLKDIETKKECEINLNIKKLLLFGWLEPIAYVIYGLSIAAILTTKNISPQTIIKIMLVAYVVNIILEVVIKFSPARYIHMLLTRSLIKSMIAQPSKLNNSDVYSLFYCYYYENETKLFTKRLIK